MKKLIFSLALVSGLALNAAAYFDGNVTGTTGPDGYKGSKLTLLVGWDNLAFEPSMTTYTDDNASDVTKTFALRGAVEQEKYTIGGLVGMTPEANNYKNKFAGADITFSLTPGSGGHSRLAGPGSRGGARGGQGITRIDVGAGLKHTIHTVTSGAADLDTTQTEASVFAGAKILMINLSGAFSSYSYGDQDASPQQFLTGQNFATGGLPRSSVNVKLDIPGQPLLTPYISYTGTKYKGGSAAAGTDASTAYLLGAYIDLNMVMANIGYQIYDYADTKDSFITIGAGVKF